MTAWKQLERTVAAVLRGVRSWETDHDVLVVTDVKIPFLPDGTETGPELLGFARKGLVTLASVEVKNLTAPTVAQLELFLAKNRAKADRDGVKYSALVIKRKAGVGRKTIPLLIVPLEEYRVGS